MVTRKVTLNLIKSSLNWTIILAASTPYKVSLTEDDEWKWTSQSERGAKALLKERSCAVCDTSIYPSTFKSGVGELQASRPGALQVLDVS